MSTAASLAELMGFEPDRIEDLKTAISESCTNAMEHGNHFNDLLLVYVTFTMEDNTLEVRVRDCGAGVKNVNPHKPDTERKLHGEEEARGMGMFLIKSLVDEAEWVRNGPEDSYTRLVIHLPAFMQEGSSAL